MRNPYFPFFLSAALLLGMWLTESHTKRKQLARRAYLFGVLGGVFGARFWSALQYGDFNLIGGMASWGFMLGATVGVVLYLYPKVGWGFGDICDGFAVAIAGGGALTKISCFLFGCCYGKVCELPWAIQYGPGSPPFLHQALNGMINPEALNSLPIHPTQLYESAILLLAFLVLVFLPQGVRQRLYPGELCAFLAVYYATLRFLIEFIRDDSGGVHFGSLTFAQATCLGVLAFALPYIFIKRWLRGPVRRTG